MKQFMFILIAVVFTAVILVSLCWSIDQVEAKDVPVYVTPPTDEIQHPDYLS